MSTPTFNQLNPQLSDCALDAIADLGFKQTTPVQAATIPLFLSHKDVCVQATTGSGKTVAFGIPIFEILQRRDTPLPLHAVGAMVIAPTRELATQIYRVLSTISKHYERINCLLFIGGTDIEDTSSNFDRHGGQIIVGTPGRVLDALNRSQVLIIKELEILVLDEADTLLDMGFRQTLNQILSMLPKQRRTGLFSATQTQELRELARAGMRNPVSIAVSVRNAGGEGTMHSQAARSIPTTLQSFYVISPYDQRLGQFAAFMSTHSTEKVIVFVSTCACVDYYSLAINQLMKTEQQRPTGSSSLDFFPPSLLVVGLHGKMAPKKRRGLYDKFVSHTSSGAVMFCTDVAARGIDIPDVDWIVQLSAPKDPSFFVHRIGRTARAGRSGAALTFISEEELPYVELLRGRGVPMVELSPDQLATTTLTESPPRNGGDRESGCGSGRNPTAINRSSGVGADDTNVEEDDDDDRSEVGPSDDEDMSEVGSSDDDISEGSEVPHAQASDDYNIAKDSVADGANAESMIPAVRATTIPSILTAIREICKTDRELLEAGTSAFISFLRAYKEHLCSYIFRLDQLDIGAVARSYTLIKLPKIAETVKYKDRIVFEECKEVNTATIPYRHRAKEEARVKRQEARLTAKLQQQHSPERCGDALELSSDEKKKLQQASRKEKEAQEKKDRLQQQQQEELEKKRKRKKREGLHKQIMNEWDELAAEETMYKKFKKGKISKEKYDDALTGDDILDIDEVVALGNRKKRDYGDSDSDVDSSEGDGDRISDSDSDGDDSSGDECSTTNKVMKHKKKNKKEECSGRGSGVSMLLIGQNQRGALASSSSGSSSRDGSGNGGGFKKRRGGANGGAKFGGKRTGAHRSAGAQNISYRTKVAKKSVKRRR